MNNLQTLLQNKLLWEFRTSRAILKKDNEAVIELKTKRKKRASFKFDGKTFSISNTGFWNPSTVIKENGKIILQMKRTMRINKAFIEITGGHKYIFRSRNPFFVRVIISSSDNRELVSYRLVSKSKAYMNISKNHGQNEQHMLLFVMIGCFIFRGIISENKLYGLKSIVFTAKPPLAESALSLLN